MNSMVINTLKDINNPDRTAFRLVGGVLVERTIGDVLPQVEGNMAGINSVITQIVATYKKKEEEFAQFTQK